jgi:hypothetical protein
VSQITTWIDLTIDLQKVRLCFFTCHLVTVTLFNWMILSFWNIVEWWHLSELFFYFWHFCFLRDGFRKNIELHNRNLLCPILLWSTTVRCIQLGPDFCDKMYILSLFLKQQVGNYFLCNVISYYLSHPIQKIRFFVRHCQNLRIFSCVNGFW